MQLALPAVGEDDIAISLEELSNNVFNWFNQNLMNNIFDKCHCETDKFLKFDYYTSKVRKTLIGIYLY